MKAGNLHPLFGGATLLLLATEIGIACFVRDDFVRPYLGDVLVVLLLYCGIRWVRPLGWCWLPVGVFSLAVGVEAAQALQLVHRTGLAEAPFFATLLGTCFSWWDILCYGIGAILCQGIDLWVAHNRKEDN